MRQQKTNQQLGYIIPVKRQLSPGRYAFGWIKSLKPDSRGCVRVRTPLKNWTSWKLSSLIYTPEGFELKEGQYYVSPEV